jgi:hypothetical protein
MQAACTARPSQMPFNHTLLASCRHPPFSLVRYSGVLPAAETREGCDVSSVAGNGSQ